MQTRKMIRRVIMIIMLCMLVSALIAVFLWCIRPKVAEELTREAGSSCPEVTEFLLGNYKDAEFASEQAEQIDMSKVADYEVPILLFGRTYTSILHVVDTVAPVAETQDKQINIGETLEPMDFIVSISDVTKTTVKFSSAPDFTVPGIQDVELLIIDEGDNFCRISVQLEILEDTEPPVIEGVQELTVAVGNSISYKKNVTVSDNRDDAVTLTVDNSAVDLNQVGDYPVTYVVQDAAGNVTKVDSIVHVKAPGVETATEEIVNARADKILADITTADMSQYEVAQAIFNWVHENVRWSDGTPKTDWVQGAYRGLFDQKGDCFVYASTSKCLLTRAGITNMDIGFANEKRIHYWNLIDLGEGWYHFDTTRRADGRSFFYCTNEEVMEYSATHGGSHAYDPAQYPTIQ